MAAADVRRLATGFLAFFQHGNNSRQGRRKSSFLVQESRPLPLSFFATPLPRLSSTYNPQPARLRAVETEVAITDAGQHRLMKVLNKIDLPGAEPNRVSKEIEEIIGLDCSDAIHCSAKEGIGVNEILTAIVKKVPPPKDTVRSPLRALIFDRFSRLVRGGPFS